MWFIGVEVEQETSASPPKKNPGSAPKHACGIYSFNIHQSLVNSQQSHKSDHDHDTRIWYP